MSQTDRRNLVLVLVLTFMRYPMGRPVLQELRIVASESTFDSFTSTRAYLEHHGKPAAFSSDKASIFRVGASAPATGAGMTQFGRALAALNIDIVCANTPQAKGRVARAHLPLQDRLVKEFRLWAIATPAAANAYLPTFRADYKRRFGREPLSRHDAHRPLRDDEDLDLIFTWQQERKLSRNLTRLRVAIAKAAASDPP